MRILMMTMAGAAAAGLNDLEANADGVMYIHPDGSKSTTAAAGDLYSVSWDVVEGTAAETSVLRGVKQVRVHVVRKGVIGSGASSTVMIILKPGNSEDTMNRRTIADEQGFILVWALLLLVVVTLLGASGISTSIFETKMAANEALHEQAFYQADGGTQNAISLLQNNINCISGFSTTDLDGGIMVPAASSNFWVTNSLTTEIPMASDTNRDFYYPSGYAAGTPHTNGRINGMVKMMAGASLQQLAGYEGKGKGIGSDGAFLVFDIKVERLGERNSKTAICLKYRVENQFANNPAGNCVY